jgi:tetratricopeptide (TPR) repeat protein
MTSWPWLLWLAWPLLVGFVTPHQLYRAWRASRIDCQSLPRPAFQQSIMLMALGVLALSLVALVSFVSFDRTIALGSFVMIWVLLVEAIAGGPLSHLLRRLIDWQPWSDMGLRVSNIGKHLGSWLGALLRVPSMPVLLGKALVGITLLVALNELPNAGKTLIQPVKVLGFPERPELGKSSAEREGAGQAILEQVVNNLGLLQQELRQEVILSLQPDSEDEEGRKKFELMSVGDSTNVSAALSKSPDLEIGGVKIPLGLLLTPVQGPIRRLLGVRAINASVQVDQPGYSLLANSDAGDTWKLTVSPDNISPANSAAGDICKITVSTDDRTFPSGPVSPALIARLAAELAFHIIKTDEMFAPALTKSWIAFSPFKMGLTEWKKFETDQDYRALSCAIVHFRAATQADPGFAFAHYRLGLALQKDGQPGAAVKAFRASLKADPSLIPAHIALASTLYDFERTSYLSEVGSPLDFQSTFPPRDERVEKARGLWLQALRTPGRADSVANLGSAYYGLCRQAYRQGRRQARLHSLHEDNYPNVKADGKTDPQAPAMTPKQWHYMAYYYCKQAEMLYASLATVQRTNPELKKGEAYVLHTLGVILAKFQQPNENSDGDQHGWNCSTDPESVLGSRESLQYFMRALDVLPDDYRLRCYAARTAYALDKHSRLLHQLEADPLAHLILANAHRRLARVCAAIEQMRPIEGGRLENATYSRYQRRCQAKKVDKEPPQSVQHFQAALHEYYEVMRRDPMNIEALTGYALTVWERLIYAGHTPALRAWIDYYAVQAVSHARKAAGLSLNAPDNAMLALVQSTLGKAFLAQGHSEWAIDKLEEAVKLVPNHPAFHEIRWALAQACLCAASTGKGAGLHDEDVQRWEKRAVKLLGDIRQQEGTREFPLYGDRPGVLTSPWGLLICNSSMGMESMPDPPLPLQAALASTSPVTQ